MLRRPREEEPRESQTRGIEGDKVAFLYGTVEGYNRDEFFKMDPEDKSALEKREAFSVKEGTESFITLASSLVNLNSPLDQKNLSSEIIREKDKKNKIILSLKNYIPKPIRFYFEEDKDTTIYDKLKESDYGKFIDDNCFHNLDINLYIYVLPIIIKYLVDFDKNKLYNFIPYKPEETVDQELLDLNLKARRAPKDKDTIESINVLLTRENIKFAKEKRKLIEEMRKLAELEENFLPGEAASSAEFHEIRNRYIALDIKLSVLIEDHEEEVNKLRGRIEEIRRSRNFRYNNFHSIALTIGQVPACDRDYIKRIPDSVNYLYIYTDGSISKDGLFESSAAYIPLVNKVVAGKIQRTEIERDTFRSELYAIVLALKWFDQNITRNKNIKDPFYTIYDKRINPPKPIDNMLIPRIFTDNYYCVFIINRCLKSTLEQLLTEGKEELFCDPDDLKFIGIDMKGANILRENYLSYLYNNTDLLGEVVKYNFTLRHVFSHSGDFGNSVADMFAGYARLNNDFAPEEFYEFDIGT